MKRLFAISLLVVLSVATASPSLAACGPSEACTDIGATLTGTIETGGDIELTWETDKENSSVDYYRILRYETDPIYSVVVTTVDAVGSCDTNEEYSYTDTNGGSEYTYTLEVWTTTNFRQCAYDAVPQ